MRWRGERRSDNIEDRRGTSLPVGGFKLGGCGLVLILVIALLTGQNPLKLISYFLQQQPTTTQSSAQNRPVPNGGQQKDEEADFVSAVLGDTEDTWGDIFAHMKRTYEPPKLVLFTDAVQSACGLS